MRNLCTLIIYCFAVVCSVTAYDFTEGDRLLAVGRPPLKEYPAGANVSMYPSTYEVNWDEVFAIASGLAQREGEAGESIDQSKVNEFAASLLHGIGVDDEVAKKVISARGGPADNTVDEDVEISSGSTNYHSTLEPDTE